MTHTLTTDDLNLLDSQVLEHPLLPTLPDRMTDALLHYLVSGRPMGGFLTYLVSGDLFNAACNADHSNRTHLADFAIWIAQTWPTGSHGTRDRVSDWIKSDGIRGLAALPAFAVVRHTP